MPKIMENIQEDKNDDKNDDVILNEKPDDEIRMEIINELELDEEEDSEKIDKLVEKEKANRQKLATAIKQKRTWREKAQAKPVVEPKEIISEKETPKNDYSFSNIKDIKALSDVHDDDIEELVDFAKFKNITVAEAKKLPVMITMLKENAEKRETAEATSTGGKRGVSETKPEALIEKASQEDLSTEDLAKAARARLGIK